MTLNRLIAQFERTLLWTKMMSQSLDDRITSAARALSAAKQNVVFTGAGVSTESGIPDFRSPGGVWARFQPVLFQDFLSSAEARRRYWAMRRELHPVIAAAQPNAAHHAIARLEQLGRLDCVVTQNIDGLHQRAGNSASRVIELHGTNNFVVCLDCDARFLMATVVERLERGEECPECLECGGILKAATVSFGQPMPPWETEEAIRRCQTCDALICVGSSLVVYPAADMPAIAKRAGATLVIVNRDPTGLDDWADHVLRGNAAAILPMLVERMLPAGR